MTLFTLRPMYSVEKYTPTKGLQTGDMRSAPALNLFPAVLLTGIAGQLVRLLILPAVKSRVWPWFRMGIVEIEWLGKALIHLEQSCLHFFLRAEMTGISHMLHLLANMGKV